MTNILSHVSQFLINRSYAVRRHRRAEALGYAYKAGTQRVPGGLIQATEVAFVPVACPFMGQAGLTAELL